MLQVFVPQFVRSSARWSGHSKRHISLGVSYLSQRLGPAASTWMTDVDVLVHLHALVVQVLPIRSLDAFVDRLTNSMPVLVHDRRLPPTVPTLVVLMKEFNIPSSPSRSVNSSTPRDGRIREHLLEELEPDKLT